MLFPLITSMNRLMVITYVVGSTTYVKKTQTDLCPYEDFAERDLVYICFYT